MQEFEMKRFSLEYKDWKTEKEFMKKRSEEALKCLNMQNFDMFLSTLGVLIISLIIRFMQPVEQYEFQYLNPLLLILYELIWICLYILSKFIQEYLNRSEGENEHTLGYYWAIFIIILAELMVTYAFTIDINGNSQLILLLIYAIHSCIFIAKILKSWLLKLIIGLPFNSYLIHQIILHTRETPEDLVILELYLAIFIWGMIYTYREELNFRRLFAMQRQIIREKEELSVFIKLTPFVIIQYNLKSKIAIQNKKGEELIQALKLKDFGHLGSKIHIKGNRNLDLFRVIKNKIIQFKRLSQQNNSRISELRRVSNDFVYLLEERKYSSRLRKIPKKIDFDINFYWKESEEDRVTIIIERKGTKERLREEKISNKCKNVMFRGMSHNLKTPLNGLLSFVDELKVNNNSTEVQSMWMNAHFLESKIDDIQDFTRIEEGVFRTKGNRIIIGELFEEIQVLCKLQADLDEVGLTFDIVQPLPTLIYGDRARLKRILLHLVQNGIKYSFKRSTVTLSIKTIFNPQIIQFSVHNYGDTINEDEKHKIFNFLNSYDNNLVKTPRNVKEDLTTTSFSLPITQQIAKAINSKIHVKSSAGEGTKFFFFLDNRSTTYNISVIEEEKEIESPDGCLRAATSSFFKLCKRTKSSTKLPTSSIFRKPKIKMQPLIIRQNSPIPIPQSPVASIRSEGPQMPNTPSLLDWWLTSSSGDSGENTISSNFTQLPLSFNTPQPSTKRVEEHNIFSFKLVVEENGANINTNTTPCQEKELKEMIMSPTKPSLSRDKLYSLHNTRIISARKKLCTGQLSYAPHTEELITMQHIIPRNSFGDLQIHQNVFTAHDMPYSINNRILSVEDNGVNRLVIKRLLEKRGFIVEEAFNGKEAIEIINKYITEKERKPYIGIFMDLNMPIMGGLECAQNIINLISQGKLRKMPIFALTAHDSEQMEEKCIEIGFDEFISKPIMADKLEEILRIYNLYA